MAIHGTLALVIGFALTALSTVVVALRFYSRYFLVRKIGSPDWVMLVALLATWCSAVVNYYMVHFMDYSKVHDLASYSKVASGELLSVWIFRLNYMLDHMLIKASILLFYNCVASSHRSFHWIVRIFLAIIVISNVIMMGFSIFLCHPVSDAWSAEIFLNAFKGIIPTQCMNPSPLWLFNACWNLATDAIIWILPIPFVLNLRTMPVKRRLELTGIFSIGILAIAASAVRVWVTVLWLSDFVEAGKQWANLLIWSQVEQHAGIIAASIPFLRPIVRKLLKAHRNRNSNSPAREPKLIAENTTPENPVQMRTPIIPSPAPTFGSERGSRPPVSPLSPIFPMNPEIQAIHTV